ncbi:MAG TPA: hypothetical protein VKO18_14600, partial [Terriglobia bacterium]|nr:hypothetical protein [Terriglobia bacterium]
STKVVHRGEPTKGSAWGLAQGKTAIFVIPPWVILREQTLVIPRERRSAGALLSLCTSRNPLEISISKSTLLRALMRFPTNSGSSGTRFPVREASNQISIK